MIKVLDPRTKIILVLFAAIYIALRFSLPLEMLFVIIYLIPLMFAKLYTLAATFLLIYIMQLLTSMYLLPSIHHPFFIYVVSFLTNGLRNLLPGIIAGTYAIKTTTVSEWIAAFKKWRFPNWLSIPISVMLRFLPTVREDYRHIRKAMAFRGLGTSFFDLLKHPAQTIENILIPLLMNATQVAEDLTVSALTKGLSLPGTHTTIVRLKWTSYDWIFLGLALIPLVLYVGGSLS